MISLLALVSILQPAHAVGTVVGMGGSQPSIGWVRAVVAADPPEDGLTDTGVAVVGAQVMVDADDAPWAWLVPLPAGDRAGLVRLQSDDFDRLFLATAPAYRQAAQATYSTTGCGGSAEFVSTDTGGGEASLDGELSIPMAYMWREPDTNAPERDVSFRVAAEQVPEVLGDLVSEGFTVDATLQGILEAHASRGGDLLVVKSVPPLDDAPVFTDIFAWRADPAAPVIPTALLSTQPATNVMLDLYTAGAVAWAPDGVSWAVPEVPEVMLIRASGALPYWQGRLLEAWEDGVIMHTYGGDRDDLERRNVVFEETMQFNEELYAQVISSADGNPLGVVFISIFVYPFVAFADALAQSIADSIYGSNNRTDEVDDYFRNLQIDELLPSGWRKDRKVHMAFQGVFPTDAAHDLSIRADADLRYRDTVVGGARDEAVSGASAWVVGLVAPFGLWVVARRRRGVAPGAS